MQSRRIEITAISISLILVGLAIAYFAFSGGVTPTAERTDVSAATASDDDDSKPDNSVDPDQDPRDRPGEPRDEHDPPSSASPTDAEPTDREQPSPEPKREEPPSIMEPDVQPHLTISGRVYDHSGAMVANALLRFSGRILTDDAIQATSRTDDGGYYSIHFHSFGSSPPGFQVEITSKFTHDTFSLRDLRVYQAGATYDLRATHDFTLSPKGAVTGRVVNPAGEPLKNVRVRGYDGESLVGGETTSSDSFMYISNEDGRYRLINVPPGEYILHPMGGPELTGYGPVERITVTVEAGKATEARDIVMSPPAKLRARVLHNGDPVANTTVLGYFYGDEGFLIGSSMPAQTDEDGWVLFEGVPAASVAFGVTVMGRLVNTRTARRISIAGEALEYGDIQVDDPVEKATVRLRLLVDGEAFANRSLTINPLDSDGWEVPVPGIIFRGFETRTDAEGWLQVALPVTAASLVLERRTDAPVTLTSTLVAGQTYDLGTIAFDE